MSNNSNLFQDAFSSGISGCRGSCHCGREHFDNYNTGISWEPGELERLQKLSVEEPQKYVRSDGSVSWIEVDGLTFVWGCECNGWQRYERFIVAHARQIAAFLRARSAALVKEAAEIAIDMEIPE